MLRTTFLATLAMHAAAFGPAPAGLGCDKVATFPCLPGIDSIGIGYDAVRGSSRGVGRPVVKFDYDKAGVWQDPFSNRSAYNYPNQCTVQEQTDQTTTHKVPMTMTRMTTSRATSALKLKSGAAQVVGD